MPHSNMVQADKGIILHGILHVYFGHRNACTVGLHHQSRQRPRVGVLCDDHIWPLGDQRVHAL